MKLVHTTAKKANRKGNQLKQELGYNYHPYKYQEKLTDKQIRNN